MPAVAITIPRMGRKRKDVDTSTYSGRVAARLRLLREDRKLTVKKMAKRLGITPTAYYYYESNDYDVPLNSVPKICRILGVTVSDFFPE